MKPALALLVAFGLSSSAFADSSETDRLVTHFDQVLAGLAAAPTGDIPPLAQARRAWLIGVLAGYRDARQFPINPRFAQPTPYFVDDLGTRCAMAHLIEATGDTALVQDVARHRNNAYVRELADDPRLVEWLGSAGLTEAEAGWIQPSYCWSAKSGHCIGAAELARDPENAGLYEVELVQPDQVSRGRVTAVHAGEQFAVGDDIDVQTLPAFEAGDRLLGYTTWRSVNGEIRVTFKPTHVVEGDQARLVIHPGDVASIDGTDPPVDELPPVPLADMLRYLVAGSFVACVSALEEEHPEADRTYCDGEWLEPGAPNPDDMNTDNPEPEAPEPMDPDPMDSNPEEPRDDSDDDDGCSSTSAPASLGLGLLVLGAVRRRRR